MKALSPVLSIILGMIFSQAHTYSFFIKYFLILILFFPFLELKFNKIYQNILWIAFANFAIAFAAYFLIVPFNPELAFIGFITAITPTAAAAPAVIGFLEGNIEYTIASVVLTNGAVALTIPFFIPLLIEQEQAIATWKILLSVAIVLAIPLVIAQTLKQFKPKWHEFILNYKQLSFYAWNLVLFIASAKATHFIRESSTPLGTIAAIAISSLVICIVNFLIGKAIGGQRFAREASQSLGQKNTMFTVWLSLAFLEPIVALGPMFYLIYHNAYNSYLIFRAKNPE